MCPKSVRALFCTIFLLSGVAFKGVAQTSVPDTLKLTLQQSEDLFLKNNLQLIAQRYNIDIASAQIITARLFANPNFSFSNGIYATQVPNSYNEHTFGIAQLFTTAGKRNKSIQLAKINVELAKYQFFDLMRTLHFTLRNDFYNIYFQEQTVKVYDQAIGSLSKTLGAFKEQYAKGNIAEKEVLRIQSELYSLQTEYNTIQTNIDTVQNEFKVLVRVAPQTYVVPQYTGDLTGQRLVTSVPYQRLIDSAYVNRYDLKAAKTGVDYNNLNLRLQKSVAVPDFSLSLGYDKLGAYGSNFLGAGLSFDLPFFNRNQGNIKEARIAIDQSKVQLQNQQNQVENDVATSYKSALRLEQLTNNFDPKFRQDFTHLIQEVFKNYQRRNISLLEFLDFYESYKNNIIQSNSLQFNRINSLEQLNYVTGTRFFNQQ